MQKMTEKIRNHFLFLSFAPIVFVSALTKQRIHLLFEAILQAYENFNRRVPTNVLNDIIMEATLMNQAPDFNGGRIRIYYATQVSNAPPTFVLFVNNPDFMHFSYQRYIENKLREAFMFERHAHKNNSQKAGRLMKITIIGAGSWGTALAKLLADNRQEVLLYDRSPGTVEEINNQHSNLTKLANSYLPVTVKATTDLSEALSFSDILVLSVPTKVIRGVLAEIAKLLTSPKLFVNTSKGLEPETYKRVSEVTKKKYPLTF